MTAWVTADLHLGHENICKFLREDGSPLRPWDTADEMDQAIIERWNARVGPKDRVYVLGDVAINRRKLGALAALKGRLCLVKGNHDLFQLRDYLPFFDDIRACVVKSVGEQRVIMTHIPIHPASLGRFGINIHGHLHDRSVDDGRYACVSLEQTDYAPITLEQAAARGAPEQKETQ